MINSNIPPPRQQPGYAIIQGGNSFGVPIEIGSNDNYPLNFKSFGQTVASITDVSASFFGGYIDFDNTGTLYLNNGGNYVIIDPNNADFFNGYISFTSNGSASFCNNRVRINSDASLSTNQYGFRFNNTGFFGNFNFSVEGNGRVNVLGDVASTINFYNTTPAPIVPTIAGWVNIMINGGQRKIPFYNA